MVIKVYRMGNGIINRIRNFILQPGFKKYFFNTGWLMLDKVLRLFVGLFVSVWVARYLEPDRFGILSFALSFVGLFASFSNLGLYEILIRNLIKEPENKNILLGTALTLRMLGALVLLIVVFIALHLTSSSIYEKTIVMIIATGQLFINFEIIDFYFQSQVKAKYSSWTSIISLTISSILRIMFVLLKLPLEWFAIAVTIEQFSQAVFYIFFYQKSYNDFWKWKFSYTISKKLLKDSWPLILSGLAVMVYLRIDQVMIKEMLGNDAVGQYAAAVKFSESWYFIPVVFAASLFPAIIKAKSINEQSYYKRLQQLYRFMVWSAIAIALPMTFLSKWLIITLYGNQYYQAGTVLMIHIWASVFVFIGIASNKWFIIENLQILSFRRTLYGMIINVLLNFILIPVYGINGAAIATLVGQSVVGYFSDYFNKKTRHQFWMKTNTLNPKFLFE